MVWAKIESRSPIVHLNVTGVIEMPMCVSIHLQTLYIAGVLHRDFTLYLQTFSPVTFFQITEPKNTLMKLRA